MRLPELPPALRHMPTALLSLALLTGGLEARAEAPLPTGADPARVSISGISSGAAMAVQYAVAHSSQVAGVGSIAGPSWGCAQGRVSLAINACMCGKQPLADALPMARKFAANGEIDPLAGERPQRLSRGFIFHSAGDATVVASTGEASVRFLQQFIGQPPVVDRGNPADGSDRAAHGILSPKGRDNCTATGEQATFVRHCGEEDNARDLFRALYPDVPFDPARRTEAPAEADFQPFSQQPFIDAVLATSPYIAPDELWLYMWPVRTARRDRLDLAAQGVAYVPPSCRAAGARCGVHVALHGCRQDVKVFARTTGFARWADLYRLIIVYPAIAQGSSPVSESCGSAPVSSWADSAWIQPNPNGCWDWWGYLDGGDRTRHLTRRAPQMQAIEGMVKAVTATP